MASNSVKYEEIEKTPALVHDDTEFAYATRSRVTTLSEEESIINTPELPPYTMEELNVRIDEAEEQIARGEVFSHEEVMAEMRTLIASWS